MINALNELHAVTKNNHFKIIISNTMTLGKLVITFTNPPET